MQIQDRKAIANSRQKSYSKFQIEKLKQIPDKKLMQIQDRKAIANSRQKSYSKVQIKKVIANSR